MSLKQSRLVSDFMLPLFNFAHPVPTKSEPIIKTLECYIVCDIALVHNLQEFSDEEEKYIWTVKLASRTSKLIEFCELCSSWVTCPSEVAYIELPLYSEMLDWMAEYVRVHRRNEEMKKMEELVAQKEWERHKQRKRAERDLTRQVMSGSPSDVINRIKKIENLLARSADRFAST